MDLIGFVKKDGWAIYRTNGTLFGQKKVEKSPEEVVLSCLGRMESNIDWRGQNGNAPVNYAVVVNIPKSNIVEQINERVQKEMGTKWARLPSDDFIGFCARKVIVHRISVFKGVNPVIKWEYPQAKKQ